MHLLPQLHVPLVVATERRELLRAKKVVRMVMHRVWIVCHLLVHIPMERLRAHCVAGCGGIETHYL